MSPTELRQSLSEKSSGVVELEQEVEVLEGELSAAQQAAKQAPSRTMKALVDRLRNQLSVKETQQRVSMLTFFFPFSHPWLLHPSYSSIHTASS